MATPRVPRRKWTLVQHSGYSIAGDRQFERAVEVAMVSGPSEERRVVKAGGVLYDSYPEADRAEYDENYPTQQGLIPKCRGSFSPAALNGKRIYVPVKARVSEPA